jgi:hypothetical protein
MQRESPPPKLAPDGAPPMVRAKRTLALLAVTPSPTRPHGRIGVAWAAVTVAAAIAGQGWLAAWLAIAAFVGASQTAGARRAQGERPPAALAGVTAVALPVAAVYGTREVLLAGAIALGVALLSVLLLPGRAMGRELGMAILIGTIAGAAAAAPVAARGLGADAAVFLLACVCIYDASAYLVGTGAASVWEGPLAGVVALIPVTILAAVVLVPPFPTGAPLLLGALAAALTPLGPLVATALLGSRETDAPGLRRLDSLIVVGPLWTWVAALMLR